MKISEIIFVAVLFSMVVGVFSFAYIDTASNVQGVAATDFSGPYNQLGFMKNMTTPFREKLFSTQSETGSSTNDWIAIIYQGAVSALWHIPAFFTGIFGLIMNVAGFLQVPPIVIDAIILLIILGFLFLLVMVMTGREI